MPITTKADVPVTLKDDAKVLLELNEKDGMNCKSVSKYELPRTYSDFILQACHNYSLAIDNYKVAFLLYSQAWNGFKSIVATS
ncbi:unnamed protein product, partial [Didymodactylos carnosus]